MDRGGSIFNRGKWSPGSIYHSGKWTGGGPYSIVVNGPRAWETCPHLFSFIIGTYEAVILRGIILFEFLC